MTKKFRLNLLFSSPLALLLISFLLSLIGQKKKEKNLPPFYWQDVYKKCQVLVQVA